MRCLLLDSLQPVRGLHLFLQEWEGEDSCRNSFAVLSAVLKHHGLLSTYQAGSSQHRNPSQDAKDSCIGELLAQALHRAEAADGAGEGHISSAWSEVLAASQPYLSR